MKMPLENVSVIIPCYNYGHLIVQTINSLLQQSHQPTQIIVVDDGSTDSTEGVVAEFCQSNPTVRYLKQNNAGPSAARNHGLKHCTGDYVQFLDADDLLEERKFKTELEIFNKYPEVDIVYGSVRYFTRDPLDPSDRLLTYWGPNEEWMPKLTGKGHNILPAALKGNFSHLSSVLFKKSIIDKVGFFDEELRIGEDYQYLLRCALADVNFYYHDDIDTYSLVRWHQNNVSKDVEKMHRGDIYMREKIDPSLVNHPEALINNHNAIKALNMMLEKSWKRYLLSGGKFDPLKKIIKKIGLEKVLVKLFYR